MQTEHDTKINAALWFALEKAGDKRKDQKDRNALEPGEKIPVSLEIDGTIDGEPVAGTIDGNLLVGFDGTTSTKTKPPADLVLALALSYVPKTKRSLLLDAGLVPPDPQLLEIATAFCDRATVVEAKPRRGSVSFEFDEPTGSRKAA